MDLRIGLDNCFCDYSLGRVYFDKPEQDDFWPENEQDYVVFGVPHNLRPRFNTFWEKVRLQLGHQLEMYSVKEGVRLSSKRVFKEAMYFLPVKSAEILLRHFDKLAQEVFAPAVAG